MTGDTLARAGLAAALAGMALLAPAASGAAEPDAREIMEKNFLVTKVPALKQTVAMTLQSDKGEARERKVELVKKLHPNGVDNSILIRFHFPPDIAGTGFLQIERQDGADNLWIYLPALKKVRRLVANNKKDSFFGSDFSYGDILTSKVDRYRHRLVGTEKVDDRPCYVVESTPASDSVKEDGGYGKKVAWIRQDNFLETKVEYYDLEGKLLKTQRLTEHAEIDRQEHHWMALRREMVNHQTGHRTTLVFSGTVVGQPMPDDYFSTRTLEREWRQ